MEQIQVWNKSFQLILFKKMDSKNDNLVVFYCADDEEYRVFCNICDKICVERVCKNHLKSQIHTNIILIQLNMDYHCDVCDKTIKFPSKNNHLKSFTHIQYWKSFQLNQTVDNPYFFHIDKIFNNYITNHNKKFGFYLLKCVFKLVFLNFTPQIKNYFHHNTTIISLKKYLLYWIEFFIERGCKFSQIIEMNITTINDKKNMTWSLY